MWMFIGMIAVLAWIVFGILWIVSLIKKNGKAKKNIIISAACFVLFVVAANLDPGVETESSAAGSDNNVVENNPVSSDPLEKVSEPIDVLRQAVHKAFGKTNSYNKGDSIVDIEFDEETGNAYVSVFGNENFTVNMMRGGMQMDIVAVMKALSEDEQFKSFQFSVVMPLVDKYGNESVNPVMNVTIGEATLNKINFENFSYRNLPDIADYYWEHPAIQ